MLGFFKPDLAGFFTPGLVAAGFFFGRGFLMAGLPLAGVGFLEAATFAACNCFNTAERFPYSAFCEMRSSLICFSMVANCLRSASSELPANAGKPRVTKRMLRMVFIFRSFFDDTRVGVFAYLTRYFLLRGTFMLMILGPWNTTPQPPVMMRLQGSPVSGCFLSGGSFMLCTTSNVRGFCPFFFGMVS